MRISEFSIDEVRLPGDDVHLSCHQIRQVISSLKQQVFTALTTTTTTGGLVAIRMERSAKLICVIVALLEIRVPFIFLRDYEDQASVGADWLFDGKELTKFSCNGSGDQPVDVPEESDICYFIRTSGTTGMQKLIGVPYSCIEPNIEDFRERFSLCSEDVILCSTSVFFDPSIVEIFLALSCGSRLLLVPDKARSHPHLLSDILRRYKPTFVQ
ncbi:hypothetical protein KIN20_031629 [Parelaphostrongylus tenuis]|uniref:AMP-dependent synthetase/ligase domain-containing protein n=1 Tax=Parelaphostrongylus tenuis TaxID=148309 RepID=A0AAD5R5E1_PARTN|nr:hypothetical protein KIN20_031629 [Parelaphostrongylus tenuis]